MTIYVLYWEFGYPKGNIHTFSCWLIMLWELCIKHLQSAEFYDPKLACKVKVKDPMPIVYIRLYNSTKSKDSFNVSEYPLVQDEA